MLIHLQSQATIKPFSAIGSRSALDLHRLQTTLTPTQEEEAVVLRKTLLMSIDDLLALVRAFLNPDVSRSGFDPSPSGLNRWRPLARLAAAWGGLSVRSAGERALTEA